MVVRHLCQLAFRELQQLAPRVVLRPQTRGRGQGLGAARANTCQQHAAALDMSSPGSPMGGPKGESGRLQTRRQCDHPGAEEQVPLVEHNPKRKQRLPSKSSLIHRHATRAPHSARSSTCRETGPRTSISCRSNTVSTPAAAALAASSLPTWGSCSRCESRSHIACAAIWLISIAVSAGFSQPLLLITSTVACAPAHVLLRQTLCKTMGPLWSHHLTLSEIKDIACIAWSFCSASDAGSDLALSAIERNRSFVQFCIVWVSSFGQKLHLKQAPGLQHDRALVGGKAYRCFQTLYPRL